MSPFVSGKPHTGAEKSLIIFDVVHQSIINCRVDVSY